MSLCRVDVSSVYHLQSSLDLCPSLIFFLVKTLAACLKDTCELPEDVYKYTTLISSLQFLQAVTILEMDGITFCDL